MTTKKIRTLLVDDETRSLETMQWLLGECCPTVEIVGMCNSSFHALEVIRRTELDLLILDIAMPVMNGFDLLSHIFPIPFPVVFVTAHNGAILRTLRKAGLPYLLKPVDDEELSALIEDITRHKTLVTAEQIRTLRANPMIE
jgi:two-component system, LytTR family, response regulator